MSPLQPPRLDPDLEYLIRAAAARITASRRTAALTGAGLSAESGIPPFRGGPGGAAGLWDRYDPMLYGTLDAFERDPGRVWVMLRELSNLLRSARPNAGHRALARMEEKGLLAAVVTQNVDGLHQAAGSRGVIEIHGNWRTMTCRRCRGKVASESVSLDRLPPLCGCGGPLKPDVILFGEIIAAPVLDVAFEQARSCECMLVVGTSAEVDPAASLPWEARRAGATIIEVNVVETALTAHAADMTLLGPAGVILPRLLTEAKLCAGN
jgi:NAD-dependent protein deacetylase/lipoamidase